MPVIERKLTDAELVILRAWMREFNRHNSTRAAEAHIAKACGVTIGRVVTVIHKSTPADRAACRAR